MTNDASVQYIITLLFKNVVWCKKKQHKKQENMDFKKKNKTIKKKKERKDFPAKVNKRI